MSRGNGRGDRAGLPIVGSSPALLGALEMARQFAPTGLPILIMGDTGTGKELLARFVHQVSGRGGTLVAVDCGALPGDLVESLLFGHRKGAFTGAVEDSEGLIAQADKGTLFLDELSSLPPAGQAKLLRVLETGEIRQLGGRGTRKLDFKLVATVRDDLAARLDEGSFRLDLIQRVAGAVVRLPALSERVEDIPVLSHHFAAEHGTTVTADAVAVLEDRPWPGNIRELRWTVKRAALLAGGREVSGSILRRAMSAGPDMLLNPKGVARNLSRDTELRAACRDHQGDATAIARALGIARATLYRKVRDAGLELRTFRSQMSS